MTQCSNNVAISLTLQVYYLLKIWHSRQMQLAQNMYGCIVLLVPGAFKTLKMIVSHNTGFNSVFCTFYEGNV